MCERRRPRESATVSYIGFALLLILSILGFIHYARTPAERTVE